jgi:AraC-like DNA-binding protein
MQLFACETTSAVEASSIMARQWSRHEIDSAQPTVNMRFRHRSIGPAVSLSALSYGVGVRIRPIAREPVLLVQMPRAGRGSARYDNSATMIDNQSHGIVDVRLVKEVVFSKDFDMLVLRIRISRLTAHLERILGRKPRHDLAIAGSIVAGSDGWQEWGIVHNSLVALDACDNNVSPHILASLEGAILSTLLVALPNNYSDDINDTGSSLAPKHVRRAEIFVRESRNRVPTVEEVAEQVGVSARSLFDGFKTFRGMTPGEFIRHIRLEKAREDLLAGRGNVTNIAMRWGYAHPGSFASQYRRRYGEFPAQTLRFGGAGPH